VYIGVEGIESPMPMFVRSNLVRCLNSCALFLGLFLGVVSFAPLLHAGVPNRIVYQGRLLKNGVPVATSTQVTVELVPSTGGPPPYSRVFTVTPGPTGDFTLLIDNITTINWLTDAPKLRLSVSGETLSPSDDFGTSPYAFVAQTVEDAAITSPKIAPAAVTDSHIAGGIAASKILVATTSLGGVTLDKWVKGTGIDASVIVGTVTTASTHAPQHRAGAPDPVQLTASQTDGTAIISSVTLPGYDQTIQPVVNAAVPLTIRGAFGGPTNSQQPILRLYGNENNNTLRFQTNVDGSSYIAGPLGVGITSVTTGTTLDVGGVLRAHSIKDSSGFVSPIGAIISFAGQAAPQGWLICDGSQVSRTTYVELFNVVGTSFGSGDGASTFNLPDFRRRVPVGMGGAGTPALGNQIGSTGGQESQQLTLNNAPDHVHNGNTDNSDARGIVFIDPETISTPQNTVSFSYPKLVINVAALANGDLIQLGGHGHYHPHAHTFTSGGEVAISSSSTTLGSPFDILPPSLVVNYIIKY
jgi:microcystin-dependent protein